MTDFNTKIIIDWLQFTLLRDDGLEIVFRILRLNPADFERLDKGGLGYKDQLINNNVRIYFNGNQGMGVNTSISGKGCRYMESQGIDLWSLLFRLARSARINITRLDLALDTSVKLIDKARQSIDKKKYIAKSRSISYICKSGKESTRTETIYLGSRSSDLMIRIYDKAVEQGLEEIDWERWEIVFKKDKIIEAIPLLKKDISQTFRNILYTYFRPIQRIESNKSRSKVENWYMKFLGKVEKVSLYSEPGQKTIEDKWQWVEKQVAPTLSLLALAFDNTEFLAGLASGNVDRIKQKDLELIRKYKEM
ncbi:replication initiation factor domain-containing protein [Peptoniphilus vaginalis]|uniref:replication initiation factor domain-containing protein n=1 Tax=Peptoniphilus vaginalis TaxID=1756987 RepID=UPI0023F64B65|nr:replication initiation factor domain-containing protein [Peptoniphilus vaginalis]